MTDEPNLPSEEEPPNYPEEDPDFEPGLGEDVPEPPDDAVSVC